MKKNNMLIQMIGFVIFLVIISVIISCFASAEITLEKTAQESIRYGDNLNVTITIINDEINRDGVEITETMGAVEPVSPPSFIEYEPTPGIIAWAPPILRWTIDLKPNEKKIIEYVVKPTIVGDLLIGKTKVVYKEETYFSNTLLIKILCNKNGICENNLSENAMNCEDCIPTVKDDICNAVEDGICDPDCVKGVDPDCEKPKEPQEPKEPQKPEKPEEKEVKKSNHTTWLFATAIILIVLIIIFWMVFRKKEGGPKEVKEDYSSIMSKLKKIKNE